ncbi:hypothetical protein GCM10007203_21450 [Staphylococcus nepalensis]|nr:hypothetical protein GCM10007203_21450 [Staphylococcus nepalensis]
MYAYFHKLTLVKVFLLNIISVNIKLLINKIRVFLKFRIHDIDFFKEKFNSIKATLIIQI